MEKIKVAQENWIGKSEGAEVYFPIDEVDDTLQVFTTRCDTLYGVTFMVISPEHPILGKHKDKIQNYMEINAYQKMASEETDIERTNAKKEKTGIKIDGLTAVHPITHKKLPIYVSDYVLLNYGTGAVMAVPAHDQRDYDFAKKFEIDIIPVISGGDISDAAYEGDGVHIHSAFLDGLDKDQSIQAMLAFLEKNKIGQRKVHYRLQDWIFSRQRFWGEPIPMIHCEECGWVPVPYADLPVTLPMVANYEPTDDGESPLANIEEWVHTTCPRCGKSAKRETDTMPNWAGSSWYWIRYMDPHNDTEFASKEAMQYWGMVDYYNGGMEHATRHLLYARFWNNFLYEQGLVPCSEPFKKRVAHGMILGANGEKMSKSKGNVVNPDEMIDKYGADALRCYELFIGDYSADVVWNENGLKGCQRFLEKVWNLGEKLNDTKDISSSTEILLHQTIKKVTEDIENMKYNTAISSLMILVNHLDKQASISQKDYRICLHLLNPIAPHITEELNKQYDLGEELYYAEWPTYDETKLSYDEKDIAVQVNGKVRSVIQIHLDMSENIVKNMALESVKKYLVGKEIKKVIVIQNRIVNIVTKD